MNKWRLVNIALLIVSLATFIGANYYWSQICLVSGCDNYFRRALIEPLWSLSLYSSFLLVFFLFIPAQCFQNFVIKIVSWLLPLSTLLILSTDPRSSHIFSLERVQVIDQLALIWGVITLLFIAWRWYKNR